MWTKFTRVYDSYFEGRLKVTTVFSFTCQRAPQYASLTTVRYRQWASCSHASASITKKYKCYSLPLSAKRQQYRLDVCSVFGYTHGDKTGKMCKKIFRHLVDPPRTRPNRLLPVTRKLCYRNDDRAMH